MSDSCFPIAMRDLRTSRRTLKAHLLSIDADSQVVELVRSTVNLPVVANLRNGLWYSPAETFSATCYFKSTDGHVSQWKFSSTRMNLHVAQLAASSKGCIIVDSTRRGKKFPDALYSTVPIWMAVLNIILFPALVPSNAFRSPDWMPDTIRDQILFTVPKLVAQVSDASKLFILRSLKDVLLSPMVPIWVVPDEDGILEWSGDISEEYLSKDMTCFSKLEYTPIVLLCTSRDLHYESQEQLHTWEYIKGAGDDEENWSRGLTPKLFWENKYRIFSLEDSLDVEKLVDDIVESQKQDLSGQVFDSGIIHLPGEMMVEFSPFFESNHQIKFNCLGYIILYPDLISEALSKFIESLKSVGIAYHLVQLISSKRGHSRDYWSRVLLPSCIEFSDRCSNAVQIEQPSSINNSSSSGSNSTCVRSDSQFVFLYQSLESNHIDACAIIAIAISYHRIEIFDKSTQQTLTSSYNPKEIFKDILLEIQSVYPNINPPRRFMKELPNYFCSDSQSNYF